MNEKTLNVIYWLATGGVIGILVSLVTDTGGPAWSRWLAAGTAGVFVLLRAVEGQSLRKRLAASPTAELNAARAEAQRRKDGTP